jgi:benzoyl-CoA reductase subunit B
MNAPTGQRSARTLACTAAANAYQKRSVPNSSAALSMMGEPFAIVQADTPHEIFHVMDIPIITNQWWSAYISAKQLSARYFR